MQIMQIANDNKRVTSRGPKAQLDRVTDRPTDISGLLLLLIRAHLKAIPSFGNLYIAHRRGNYREERLSWAWWRIGRDDAFRPDDRGLDSRSGRHVETLSKSFTYSCL